MRDAFLDLVAGGSCVVCGRPGRRLCPRCLAQLRPDVRRVRPSPCPPGLLPVLAVGDYDAALREVVLAHKERAALGLAVPLGRLLGAAVTQAAAAGPVTLVPVPSHPAVVRARGHDPVLRVVRRCSQVLRSQGRWVRVRRPLLVVGRPRDQAGLDAHERRRNLDGRFRGRPARPPDGCVLLVDDVVTTGATLREAQRALVEAGWRPRAAVTLAATRRRRPT